MLATAFLYLSIQLRGGHLCRVADNTVWSHWQVASHSSEVNVTKNYTLIFFFLIFILALSLSSCIFIFWVIRPTQKCERVKMMGSRGNLNAIWWNIKINLQKLVDIWIWKASKSAKFHAKRLNQKSFRGATFFKTPCISISASVLLHLLVCSSLTITGQPRNSAFICRV